MSAIAAAPARADLFGEISLVSEGSLGEGVAQQFEYAHDPAISGDGRYVAFDGSFGGQTGVWRRDLATGAIERVAGGDAELPSISEEGRYISFTSAEQLVPADETTGPNVWVRDMEPEKGQPEYLLASAVNGSNKGLTYSYRGKPGQERQQFGSVATGRSAISANGQEVAFVTTAVSNLVLYPQLEREEEEKGETPKPHTPALQVAVRNLRTGETRLVSGEYNQLKGQTTDTPVSVEEDDTAFGAVYPGPDAGFGSIPKNGRWGANPPPGASISADGSTVAWMGEDIEAQARMLPDEFPSALYTEPLWRRIAPGSETPTERVTGGSEPDAPGCAASGEDALPELVSQSVSDPCQGPFRVELIAHEGSRGVWSEAAGAQGDFVPRLSEHGETVAFIASAPPIALGVGFTGELQGESPDLYVASMSPELTRDQALTPLTEIAGASIAASDPITDFDISPDGSQVAFTTRRTEFPLGSPAYVSSPLAEPGESELYDVDLGDDTLTRVTHGYEGGPSEQRHGSKVAGGSEDVYGPEDFIGAQSPSFTSNGEDLAFSSTASNLVFGDTNEPPGGPFDGSDAFLVARDIFSSTVTPQSVSPAPDAPEVTPAWRLGVTAVSQPDGSVTLYAEVPANGTLSASARSSVATDPAPSSHKRQARAGARRPRGHAARSSQARAKIAAQTVANVTTTAGAAGGGMAELELALAPRYRALASSSGGLSANVTVVFASPGHPALRESLQVTFLRTAAAVHSGGKRSAAKSRSRPRGTSIAAKRSAARHGKRRA